MLNRCADCALRCTTYSQSPVHSDWNHVNLHPVTSSLLIYFRLLLFYQYVFDLLSHSKELPTNYYDLNFFLILRFVLDVCLKKLPVLDLWSVICYEMMSTNVVEKTILTGAYLCAFTALCHFCRLRFSSILSRLFSLCCCCYCCCYGCNYNHNFKFLGKWNSYIYKFIYSLFDNDTGPNRFWHDWK